MLTNKQMNELREQIKEIAIDNNMTQLKVYLHETQQSKPYHGSLSDV